MGPADEFGQLSSQYRMPVPHQYLPTVGQLYSLPESMCWPSLKPKYSLRATAMGEAFQVVPGECLIPGQILSWPVGQQPALADLPYPTPPRIYQQFPGCWQSIFCPG